MQCFCEIGPELKCFSPYIVDRLGIYSFCQHPHCALAPIVSPRRGLGSKMVRNNAAFTAAFIDGLRRDTARWKAELSMLDVGDKGQGRDRETSELRSWIAAGEEIFARYESQRSDD